MLINRSCYPAVPAGDLQAIQVFLRMYTAIQNSCTDPRLGMLTPRFLQVVQAIEFFNASYR